MVFMGRVFGVSFNNLYNPFDKIESTSMLDYPPMIFLFFVQDSRKLYCEHTDLCCDSGRPLKIYL